MDKSINIQLFFSSLLLLLFSEVVSSSVDIHSKLRIAIRNQSENKVLHEFLLLNQQDILYTSRFLPWTVLELTKNKQHKLLSSIPGLKHHTLRKITPLKSIRAKQALHSSNDFPTPLQMCGVKNHNKTLSGKNVRIAVMDDGFQLNHSSIRNLNVVAFKDFTNSSSQFSSSLHGTHVLELIGGQMNEHRIGLATEAQFILAKVFSEDTHEQNDELNWIEALEWAYEQGAHIVNSSFVYPDKRAVSQESTYLFELLEFLKLNGVFVVCAAGNEGTSFGSIQSPASYRNVIAIGSVDARGFVSDFSSRGETEDGFLKPELCLPGENLYVFNHNNPHTTVSGTSFSAALFTSMLALHIQEKPRWSYEKRIDSFIASGDHVASPNRDVGYGIPNFQDAIEFPKVTFEFDSPGFVDGYIIFINPSSITNNSTISRITNQQFTITSLDMGNFFVWIQPLTGKAILTPLRIRHRNLYQVFQ